MGKYNSRAVMIGAMLVAAIVLPSQARGEDVPPTQAATGRADKPQGRQVFFGDLHLHTELSFDAYSFGTRTSIDDAYRFARGEVIDYQGFKVRRQWPLDFVAVTDHPEFSGVLNQLADSTSAYSQSELGKNARAGDVGPYYRSIFAGRPVEGTDSTAVTQAAWQKTIEAARRNYVPGRFTTFIGYEWASTPVDPRDGAFNIHRNIIFSGASAPLPFTMFDSRDPEDLWTYLERSREAGEDAIAIPHNSNASIGRMFDCDGGVPRRISRDYAERRLANEPLVEIGQTKGVSETMAGLSPHDAFADFEVMDFMAHGKQRSFRGGFVREALACGLAQEQMIGINPLEFGFVGGTDIHNGLSTSNEDAFGGGVNGIDPAQEGFLPEMRRNFTNFVPANPAVDFWITPGSGNLTGVWAAENTREAIFGALRRREVFATSGSRLKLRFFGGWNLPGSALSSPAQIDAAYRTGVPTGGRLPAAGHRMRAPRFLLSAERAPDGAGLERLQIIKVWWDKGQFQERIHDVALARRAARRNAGQRNAGAARLAARWVDPAFDPATGAAYYARVLEIPTPRWSTIQAGRAGLTPSASVPAMIRERGWSSPIFYLPPRGGN